MIASLPLLAALALPQPAQAQDFSAEVHERMKLSFDLDQVRELIDAPPPEQVAMAALPLEPNSEVDTVTVFRDRAVVTRLRTERLPAGSASLTFEGLPPGLEGGTLHAVVRSGSTAAEIVGVEQISGVDLARDEARREAVRDELRPIADELGEVRDRIEALLAQRLYLRSTLLQPATGDRPQPSLAQVRDTAAYVAETERHIAAELRREEERARELDEQLAPLLTELGNPLARGEQVRVDLELPAAGTVEVALRYQVGGAGWAPAYRARLDPDAAEVSLEYLAVVSQATGETWDAAALTLSSATPWVSSELPQLTPWILEDGHGLSQGVGQVTGPLTGAGGGGGSGSGSGQVLQSDLLATEGGGGGALYVVPGRRDIAGDGSAQRIPLGTQSFPAALDLDTAPRVTPQVLRSATLTYAGSAPLLPGEVQAYVGGDFVGESRLGNVVPGETVALGFGADERVRVARELVSRKREGVGMGKRQSRWTFTYRISVQNLRDQAVSVDVRDQVPVSADERVSVKILEATGIAEALQADPRGLAEWSLELAPGETRQLTLSYSVTAPHTSEIGGHMEMMMM